MNSINHEDKSYLFIVAQIDQLNAKNQRLLSIADHIMKYPLAQMPSKPPLIIAQIQQDLRASFNKLIEALRQYFNTIDIKVKEICSDIQTRKIKKQMHSKQQNTQIAALVTRIEHLQYNLKRTQQNETKMLSVIEKIVYPLQQSTTLPKQKDSNHYETSFNLLKSQQNSCPQLYPHPSSPKIDNYKAIVARQPSSAYCFPYGINDCPKQLPAAKRSLKGQKEMDSAKKFHKLNYMMNVLKH